MESPSAPPADDICTSTSGSFLLSEFSEFNPTRLLDGVASKRVRLVLGRRKSGKSTCVRALLGSCERDRVDAVYSFCPTSRAQACPLPTGYALPDHECERWDADHECERWDENLCRMILAEAGAGSGAGSGAASTKLTVVVLDDCDATEAFNSAEVATIATTGLIVGIGLVLTAQSGALLPPLVRGNVDELFFYPSHDDKENEFARTAWAPHCSRHMWSAVVREVRDNIPHACIVVDVRARRAARGEGMMGEGMGEGLYFWTPRCLRKPPDQASVKSKSKRLSN